ncbi:MAG TPA: phosphate ABC transporter substrate-binding protein PstS, partial [Bryobacteraceae bacterium]|nr:phosphate ABC transporter substrate-binding protein PstS [Bryobacteraceae bacterium]
TPARSSEDISRELAKKIARHVEEALPRLVPRALEPGVMPRETQLREAGATFPSPVYEKWFKNYHRQNPAVTLSYFAVGSEAGVRSLLNGEVNFAASDSPVALQELAPSQESNYLMFPAVIGAVVPIVNLPKTSPDLQLTPQSLVGIYSGQIKKWNDPAIRQSNRGVHLPDLDIQVIHRSDGSGASHAFTDFLSQTDSIGTRASA